MTSFTNRYSNLLALVILLIISLLARAHRPVAALEVRRPSQGALPSICYSCQLGNHCGNCICCKKD